MIHDFETWTANFAESAPLNQLSGSVIGIEAAEYLNAIPKLQVAGIDRKIKEELTVALGGYPLGYKAVIQQTVAIWKKFDITPVFVFSGLDVGKKDTSFARFEEAEKKNAQAWEFYDSAMVAECLEMFGKSESITAEDMFRFLQEILTEEGVEWVVAPYGAWAQLAYLQTIGVVDAVAGSSELFLYDVPELIFEWDFTKDEFTWIRRRACIADLGNVSPDIFLDACLLAGSSILPSLPQLETTKALFKIRSAVELIMGSGRTGHSVCLRYQDDPQFRALNYMDRYRRARMAVKHHIVLTKEGKVEPFRLEEAPNDVHEFIGQRLPEELYYYLSKGIISPRVLNWRTSCEILEAPPLDNGHSEEYRRLVKEQLVDIRTQTLSLLSQSLTRFYQHKDVTLRCWFSKEDSKALSVKDYADSRPIINSWNVPDAVFGPELAKYPNNTLLGFAVLSLQDSSFAAKTITKKNAAQPLSTKPSLLLNAIWRFLHLRSYLSATHTLTPWGKVLASVLSALPSPNPSGLTAEYEAAALVAVELLRLGLLNADYMFPTYSSLGFARSETDRRNVLLVSRVAGLGVLRHKQIGFTGALSRHLLGWRGVVDAVRAALRDGLEVALVTLLMNGDGEREGGDLVGVGQGLPLPHTPSCSLALAMNIYLNKVLESSPPSPAEAKAHGQDLVFEHCEDFAGDIDAAFGVWDAVVKGVKVAGELEGGLVEKGVGELFGEVDGWVGGLR